MTEKLTVQFNVLEKSRIGSNKQNVLSDFTSSNLYDDRPVTSVAFRHSKK